MPSTCSTRPKADRPLSGGKAVRLEAPQLQTFGTSFILPDMAVDNVARWEPAIGLPERPAETFDLGWQGGEQRLIATVRYATNLDEDDDTASAVIIFENVYCFKVLEENMDGSQALVSTTARLKVTYPYGGRWPFLEVESSAWIAELAMCHGVWTPTEFRHLIITSRNMHLHVACRRLSTPAYHGTS